MRSSVRGSRFEVRGDREETMERGDKVRRGPGVEWWRWAEAGLVGDWEIGIVRW